MKVFSPILGLVLIGLIVPHTLADISLKLKNKAYIPPPIQELPIQGGGGRGGDSQHQQQQVFHEDKYANSRYQIFEVHSHYEPGSGGNEQLSPANNEYLPPSQPQEEEIRIQHINAPADFPFDDPNLDVSYINLASGSDSNNQQIIVKHEHKVVRAPSVPANNVPAHNAPSHNVPVPFPSNYQHNIPKNTSPKAVEFAAPKHNSKSFGKSVKSRQRIQNSGPQYQTQQQQQKPQQVANIFKASQQYSQQLVQNSIAAHQLPATNSISKTNTLKSKDYLPPVPSKSVVGGRPIQNVAQNTFKGADYLPPHNSRNGKSSFKGADYLPPHQGGSQPQQHSMSVAQSSAFKGSDYLPPHQGVSQPQQQPISVAPSSTFKGSDYLPPHQGGSVQQEQRSFEPTTSFKAPDYLPPHQGGSVQQQQTTIGRNIQFKASQQEAPVQQQHNNFVANIPFKGADYLPPQQSGHIQQQTSSLPNNPFKGPDYLPPQQGFQVQPETQTTFVSNQVGAAQQQSTSFQPTTAFKGSDYLPPHQDVAVPQQQQSTSFPQTTVFNAPTQQQQTSFQQQPAFKAPDYLPPHGNQVQQQHESQYHTASNFLPSGYDIQKPEVSEQATLPQQSQPQYQEVTVGSQIQVFGREQSNDIIYGSPKIENPPQPAGLQQATGFLPSGYDFPKPENSEQAIQQLHSQNTGLQQTSGYLPPGYDSPKPENSEPAIQQLHSQGAPQQSVISTEQLLPDGYDFEKPDNSEVAIEQLHSEDPRHKSSHSKANEFLPTGYEFQKPADSEQAIQQLHSQNIDEQQSTGRATTGGYLPPGYDFQKPEEPQQAITSDYQIQSQQIETINQAPVQQQQQSYSQAQTFQSLATQGQVTKLLPVTPQAQTYQQVQSQVIETAQVSQLPQTYQNQQTYPQVQSQVTQTAQVSQQPQIYQNQQTYSQVQSQVTQSAQVSQQSQTYQNPTIPQQTYSQILQNVQNMANSFKGPDYLPPVDSSSISNSQISQTTGSAFNYKAPDYLPPVISSTPNHVSVPAQVNQQSTTQVSLSTNYQAPSQPQHVQQPFKASDYLPPTLATPTQPIQTTHMYPLSSFMTHIQPHERYGKARKPFLEYGPPPTTASTVLAYNDVSPMYREPAKRPQYYAPTMSYSNNAFNGQTYTTYRQNQYSGSSTLNQQTRQTLQTFMPQGIRQEISAAAHSHSVAQTNSVAPPALQTTKAVTSSIRTVQIVNPTDVKTLKVLESLDHSGVKTIKILGSSQEQPMGEHRVVKVVSGNHGETEQTVKIFNDHQDVTSTQSGGANNGYLPPRQKRNPKKFQVKGRSRN